MERPHPSKNGNTGVALLMVLGILALLAILAAAFSSSMRMREHSSRSFTYEKQAQGIAEAGIEYAIAKLKDQARTSFIYTGEGFTDIEGEDTDLGRGITGKYYVDVIDTASQININTANKALLECLHGIGETKAQAIIDERSRMGKGGFITKQSICLSDGVGEDTFSAIKDLITAHGYIDPNVLDESGNIEGEENGRSAININSVIYNLKSASPRPYLEDMLIDMFDAVPGVGETLAQRIVDSLKSHQSFPFESWEEFRDVIDAVSGIGPSTLAKIDAAFNPNRAKPVNSGGTPAYTTEFCFHSGGIYEITSRAELKDKNGSAVAEKTITAVVKIFDLWNQTTKEQFGAGTLTKTTYEDTCPVRSDDNWNSGAPAEETDYDETSHSTNYLIIKNALKTGYWDEFNEQGEWQITGGSISFTGVADMSEGSEMILGEGNDLWKFTNCSATINAEERVTDRPNWGNYSPNSAYNTIYYTGWFIFRYAGSGNEDSCTQAYIERVLDAGGAWLYDITPPQSPFVYTVYPIQNEWVPGEHDPEWGSASEFFITKSYRAVQNEAAYKLFMVKGNDTTDFFTDPDALRASGDNRSNTDGGWIKLYTSTWALGKEGGTHWDNLRIIPDEGEYTSVPSDTAYNKLTLASLVEWGTLWGTITKPDSAADPEKDVDIKAEVPFGSGNYTDFSQGIPIEESNSVSIQYRLKFYSNYSDTNNYSETPVLEDVWITYLPETEILYWSEVQEDEG